jgi:hypothetical protein
MSVMRGVCWCCPDCEHLTIEPSRATKMTATEYMVMSLENEQDMDRWPMLKKMALAYNRKSYKLPDEIIEQNFDLFARIQKKINDFYYGGTV